jgi:hypothetical protein
MAAGTRRTLGGRVGAALGFVCGVLGLMAALMNHTWKLGVTGWFSGGSLLTLIALFSILDGAIEARRAGTARSL